MKSFGIIYKAENKINGKVYIGQTTKSLKERRKRHIWETKKSYFHNALNKYKPKNFKWEVLEYCDSKNEMNEMEFHYIKQYDSLDNGYNLTLGGEGVVGNKVSKESRKKMSLSHKGIKMPPFTEEHKRKISESHLGDKNPNFGKSMPVHVKDMLIDINKKMVGAKNPLSKKYVITTPSGKGFVVIGLNYFCKNYKKEKLNRGNMANCAIGGYKQHKGYKCRYFDETLDSDLPIWEE